MTLKNLINDFANCSSHEHNLMLMTFHGISHMRNSLKILKKFMDTNNLNDFQSNHF